MAQAQVKVEAEPEGPFDYKTVEKAEFDHIVKRRPAASSGRAALCLSGGGVRSASFCLGVVRALAGDNLFRNFDYLSTVSGGGFTGAFLARWIREEGCISVEDKLKNDQAFSGDSALHHLRRYIAYLTPRLGLLSLDSLAAGVLYLRNLLINWLVIMPWIFVICLLPQFTFELISYFKIGTPFFRINFLCVAAGLGFYVYQRLAPNKPPFVGANLTTAMQDPKFEKLFLYFRAPVFLVFLCLMAAAAGDNLMDKLYHSVQVDFADHAKRGFCSDKPTFFCTTLATYIPQIVVFVCVFAFLAHLFSQLERQSALNDNTPVREKIRDPETWRQGLWLFAALTSQVAVALGIFWLMSKVFLPLVGGNDPDALLKASIVLMPAVLQFTNFVADAVFIALRSNQPWSDIEQEWTARLGGSLFLLPVLWALIAGVALLGPGLNTKTGVEAADVKDIGLVSGGAGILGLLLTKLSSAYEKAKKGIEAWQAIGLNWGLWLVLTVFFAATLLLFSQLGNSLAYFFVHNSTNLQLDKLPPIKKHATLVVAMGLMLAVCVVLSLAVDRFSNLNKFSLHSIYRNRLVRAFVGASNPERARHEPGFLNMLRNDNIALCELAAAKMPKDFVPPFLVINMALNIPGSSNEALQERRALPFTATPLHTGSAALPEDNTFDSPVVGQYRPSSLYASESYAGTAGGAFSLGGAIAISGAAFDPTMGRFGSAAMRMLMTLFNVRLGAWLGNPGPAGHADFKRKGPVMMAVQLAREFLGLADENKPFVHLSDGGHFENLAVYEMLRRRCAFIVVVDAGCDPDYMFEDLGSLQRMARVDLNATIEFPVDELEKFKSGDIACTKGTISYRDRGNKHTGEGVIWYIKPAMIKGVQPEIQSYRNVKSQFPHETTVNQFFTESQFLAYLALGQMQGRALVNSLKSQKLPQMEGWNA